ncbi:MAG: selenocysteine-specific translation elongation factor [Methylocystaceae bacterium]|nr:MAG: selenocysteine-specific translation elongation factor [Methylocystaceae bacterium]
MIVGTAGHVDHGKTSLVRALTGVDADRLKEEKERGVTIDLGFAYMPTQRGEIVGFVDAPGHEKFVHNMLAGATGIDFVLLVVAADDGVMPQTLEHLAIVDLLGVERGAVALTKADAVAPERLEEARREIAATLSGSRLAGADIFPVSNVTGEGVEHLRAFLVEAASIPSIRASDRLFRLAVDRSFTLRGTGTVVTGTVMSGVARIGDAVTVSPTGLACRIRSIHAQNVASEEGRVGQRCALNLAGEGVAKDAIRRGDVVAAPPLHAPTLRLDAKLRVLASEAKPIRQWTPVRLHHGAAEVGARIVPLDAEALAPGAEGFAQIVLENPVAAIVGDRFVLRDTSAQRTIGGGRIVDLRAPPRRRRTPERLAQLEALTLDAPEAALRALLARPPFHQDLYGFARDHGLSAEQAEDIAERLGLVRLRAGETDVVLDAATFARSKQDLLAAVAAFHESNPDLAGVGLERLRLSLQPKLPTTAFKGLLERLARAGEVFLRGAWVRLPGHEARLSETDAAHWVAVAPLLAGEERFRPPRVRDIAHALDLPEPEVRRLLKAQSRMGQLDEIAHDHFFPRATTSEMVDILASLAASRPNGEFNAAQFRDRVENGRKVAIQILEFFDRHGVTLRRGDLRRVNPHRLDLFRVAPEAEQDKGN